ncbi:MAG: hypothetical protein GY774_17860 [Planctomycetes bacterium]|nr:hypothetical protein [Planctomycetota bacterium]
MNEKFFNITIQNDENLLEACDILHDGYLDISKIQYNEAAGAWEAPFEREYLEDPSKIEYERKYLIFNKVSFPAVHSVLSLEGVKTYHLEDKSKIQKFRFNECQIKNNTYKFAFCENMDIYFTFNEKPKGNFKDCYFLKERKSFLTIGKPFKNKN